MLFFCIYTNTSAQKNHDINKDDESFLILWEKEFTYYAKTIENHFGILFDSLWKPKVFFFNSIKHSGQYRYATQDFLIARFYKNLVPISEEKKFLIQLVCHELGHALTDQYSRRMYGTPWLDIEKWEKKKKKEKIIEAALLEGVAEYIGYTIAKDTTLPKITSLPKRKRGSVWYTHWYYTGGYWTVKPIIDSFGIQGIEYIIKNKSFPIKNWNIRKGAILYQKKAFFVLKKRKE